MKKIKTTKLALSTETLAPLTGTDLDGVHGGGITDALTQATRTLTTVSVGCGPATLACPTLRCFGGAQ